MKLVTPMETPALATPAADPAPLIARAAGLRYVGDHQAGIERRGKPGKFHYVDADGQRLKDEDALERIRKLAIPPAWTDVWICTRANGHVQATGRDARGRKQYRYHARWRQVRDEAKYERMLSFGRALPAIREAVDAGMKLPGMPREKVLATIVHLLELTMMRIGNEEYARTNKSFGLTTLRTRHVKVTGSGVEFHFRGKSGVHHDIKLSDRRLARVLQTIRDLPGQELFQYLDEDGQRHGVDSGDVNDYLRDITGEDYTAKDFRTWSGTLLAALALEEFEKVDSEAQAKKNIVQAIESVARKLGNTPSICRKCYVHPAVLDSYLDGSLLEGMKARALQQMKEDLHALAPEEAAVLALLQRRLQSEDSVRKNVRRRR
ncbi:DNA topoisomerase IB [Janthinobacterium psychrotolerans]|uniref:DNA topoisomerase n=1 Tax=Janthinobacterium psychrotolerans TaxID=1747903 RepID=A0A1A7BWE1_9BURK|nr:DNA topoisomerase IB [Janthinobacterium psychrotolerans]OBV37896.1 DNA topoisomerase-1 [Janthinobacterium psychrotolerans]